jgi:nucleotide-binding universal stress UspA family protein
MFEWKRICCAVDFSEPSRIAMLQAAELARDFGCELELLHVHPPPPAVSAEMVARPEELGERVLVELEATMAGWRGEAERIAGRAVRSTVLPGDAAREIARFAAGRAADLVVVGTHGRTGLKRLILGSAAARVVREAPCTVLVARGREGGEGEGEAATAGDGSPR